MPTTTDGPEIPNDHEDLDELDDAREHAAVDAVPAVGGVLYGLQREPAVTPNTPSTTADDNGSGGNGSDDPPGDDNGGGN